MADSRRLLISSAPFYSFLSRRSDASAIRAATARRNTSRFWTAIYGSLFVLSSLSFPTTRGSEAMTTVSRRRPLPSSFLQTAFKWPSGARGIANPSMPLRLNRLLFEPEEIYHGKDDETLCYAAIPPCDARTVHIKEVCKYVCVLYIKGYFFLTRGRERIVKGRVYSACTHVLLSVDTCLQALVSHIKYVIHYPHHLDPQGSRW